MGFLNLFVSVLTVQDSHLELQMAGGLAQSPTQHGPEPFRQGRFPQFREEGGNWGNWLAKAVAQ